MAGATIDADPKLFPSWLTSIVAIVLTVLGIGYLFDTSDGIRVPDNFFPADYVRSTTWGTYRPGVYFGMRQRIPEKSPSFGLAWSAADGRHMRHDCDGGLTKFGWLEHDGRGYGKQSIEDGALKANLTTSFVASDAGWRFKLDGTVGDTISVFLYFADVEVAGASSGSVSLPTAAELRTSSPLSHVRFVGSVEEDGWNAPAILENVLVRQKKKKIAVLPNTVQEDANWFAWQITLEKGACDVTVKYGDAPDFGNQSAAFWSKFTHVFPGIDAADRPVLAAGFANMLGGVGYFTGSLKVESGVRKKQKLFTGTPSRSFFPRGFLWDEGFHSLLFIRWDHWLFMDIVFHWLGLQDSTGWIPRECAIGDESQTRVPPQFLEQKPEDANPPSLLLAINDLLDARPPQAYPEVLSFVNTILPALGKWFDYLDNSQKSATLGCYRWRRNAAHCLSSGLDDYPRGLLVDDAECHLDLQVWMTFFAASMHRICQEVTETTVCGRPWHKMATALNITMYSVLNTSEGLKDYLGKQPVVKGKPIVKPPWREDGRCGPEFRAECRVGQCCSPSGWCGDSPDFCECPHCGKPMVPLEERRGKWAKRKAVHSPHIGYVSLFPLMFGLVEQGPAFERLIATVDGELRSDAGIMSLSKADELFGQGEKYWRGKVWGNLNFLVLQAISPRLHHLSQAFVSTVIKGYREDNYFMENYDPANRRGTGARPFTGWTASAALLLATNQTTSSDIPRLLRYSKKDASSEL